MKWRAVAFWLLSAGFYFLALAYIGDLPKRPSVVLALVLASLSSAIDNTARKPALRFSPYWVHVEPHWYHLLSDFKLIGKPEEWEAIQKSIAELPPTEYNVLRNGVFFTVVQESEDGERTLIYWDNRKSFASQIKFREDLDLRPFSQPLAHARFFMKYGFADSSLKKPYEGISGYDLGIEVRDEWWESVKAQCPKPLHEDHEYSTGTVRLALARISLSEFDCYWDPVEGSTTWRERAKTKEHLWDRIHEHRKNQGWKVDEDALWRPVKHEYFTVYHDAL